MTDAERRSRMLSEDSSDADGIIQAFTFPSSDSNRYWFRPGISFPQVLDRGSLLKDDNDTAASLDVTKNIGEAAASYGTMQETRRMMRDYMLAQQGHTSFIRGALTTLNRRVEYLDYQVKNIKTK